MRDSVGLSLGPLRGALNLGLCSHLAAVDAPRPRPLPRREEGGPVCVVRSLCRVGALETHTVSAWNENHEKIQTPEEVNARVPRPPMSPPLGLNTAASSNLS